VGLGQVLVDRPLPLDQIRHGVEAHAVDPEIEPEPHHVNNGFEHPRIVEVQIGLVSIKTMPVIGLRHRIPRPVGFLGVDKDDAGFGELLVGIAPKVEVA
jgi:hypothetical protein